MLELLKELWKKSNLQVVTQAPLPFGLTALLFGYAGWIANDTLHVKHIEVLKSQISQLQDQIGEYRERLGVVSRLETTYSVLTDEELRDRVFELTSKMRDYNRKFEEEENELRNKEWSQMRAAENTERKQEVWDRFRRMDSQRRLQFRSEYSELFSVDAKALRDELLKRLPEGTQVPDERFVGRTIELGLIRGGPDPLLAVAEYLDGLAKLLHGTPESN